MNTEKGMIFRNTPIFNSSIFIILMVAAVYVYFYVSNGTYPAILMFLTGLLALGYLLLFNPFSITASRIGISQNSVFRAWNFRWNEIKGWNVVSLGESKRTIWFRTGANIYKISPDVLRGPFKENEVEKLKAYFEKYCGKQLEGDDRLGSSLSHWF